MVHSVAEQTNFSLDHNFIKGTIVSYCEVMYSCFNRDKYLLKGGNLIMKRLLVTFLILLSVILFVGCGSKGSSLSTEQRKAVDNCIEFINNSSFTSKDRIDTDIIKIENATANTWKYAWYEDSPIKDNAIDLADWVITIGDTSFHDFAIIICDSDTYKVIGYSKTDGQISLEDVSSIEIIQNKDNKMVYTAEKNKTEIKAFIKEFNEGNPYGNAVNITPSTMVRINLKNGTTRHIVQ